MLLKPFEIAFAIVGIIIGLAVGIYLTVNYINVL